MALSERPPLRSARPGSPRLDRLAALQVRRPLLPLAVAAVLSLVSAVLALRLTVRTGFDSLLPESRPSVQELRRVTARVSGVSALFVVMEGGPSTPPAALQRAGDQLVAELTRLGPPSVGSAESGVHEAKRFLEPRAGLYASREALERLRAATLARYEHEVAKEIGALLDEAEPPPELSADQVRELLGIDARDAERFPGGYYQSVDGRALVVAVRSKLAAGDFSAGIEALRQIRGVVERVDPASFDPAIRWGFAGDLASSVAEYQALQRDLTEVGAFGLGLLAAVVLLYYLRLRALLAMGITVGIGLSWTFGLTYLMVGHLTIATGFLFTIIAGNGINFAIIFMARYLEARRAGADLLEATRTAHVHTWFPTLTASCAAAVAYGSLAITDFRGFRDFGLIGGAGMILFWIATYWTLPSVLALLERAAPLIEPASWLDRLRGGAHGGVAFGAPFAALVRRRPRGIVVAGALAAGLGFVVTARYIASDPMEYDLRRLRTDTGSRAEEIRLNRLADGITGFVGLDGMAIVVDRREQVAPLKAILEARRDRAPAGLEPFRAVHTLDDFVPRDQAEKIPILLEIRSRISKASARGMLPPDEVEAALRYLPPADLAPFGEDDLPEAIAGPFTENDGTRGRIVYLSPIYPGAVDDAHYLFRWADAYRETVLPDGSVVRGSGRAVIFADMWAAMIADVPSAVLCSLAGTILVIAAAFRRGIAALIVLGSLIIGVGWTGALLVALGVKLHFLNFIALPITFGVGVDYAVNVVQRYLHEGAGGAVRAVHAAGGAVVLCSLTTTLGYLALTRSDNHAVRSLGVAAAVGEIGCLLAAVLVLPAALVWRDQRSTASDEELRHHG
jgi:uncharacterized protein